MAVDAATMPTVKAASHPNGLYVLAFTELWERFSFYGLQALLFLYLTKHFRLTDARAFEIIGSYVALVFMLPVIGGLISDRWLGARQAIVFGGVLLAIGHFGMMFEGAAHLAEITDGQTGIARDGFALQALFLSLALVATGVGFLKSNISTLVGELYARDDPRKDAGFTIFYMGINVGVFLGPLVCGYLGETYGWRYGFGAAGVGMLVGLVVFLCGRDLVRACPSAARRVKARAWQGQVLSYLVGLVLVAVAYGLLQAYQFLGYGMLAVGALVVAGVAVYSLRHCSREQQRKHLAAFVLMLLATVFWSLFAQAGSSLTAMTDRMVDRSVFGFEIKTSQFQSLNAVFILLFGPLIGGTWRALALLGRDPSTVTKFALGLAQGGLAFLVLVVALATTRPGGMINVAWLVATYFLLTTGELCISPIGLSAMTKLAAPAIAGLMMGAWFMATAGAGYIGSLIARLTIVAMPAGGQADLASSSHAYASTFLMLFLVAIAVAGGALLPALTRTLKGAAPVSVQTGGHRDA